MSYNERLHLYYEDMFAQEEEDKKRQTFEVRQGPKVVVQQFEDSDPEEELEEFMSKFRVSTVVEKMDVVDLLLKDKFSEYVRQGEANYFISEFIGDKIFNSQMAVHMAERVPSSAIKAAYGHYTSNKMMSDAIHSWGLSPVGDLLSSDMEVACYRASLVGDQKFVVDLISKVYDHIQVHSEFTVEQFKSLSIKINKKESDSHLKHLMPKMEAKINLNDGGSPFQKLAAYASSRFPISHSFEHVGEQLFECTVSARGKSAHGRGRSKQAAKEMAATNLINILNL